VEEKRYAFMIVSQICKETYISFIFRRNNNIQKIMFKQNSLKENSKLLHKKQILSFKSKSKISKTTEM